MKIPRYLPIIFTIFLMIYVSVTFIITVPLEMIKEKNKAGVDYLIAFSVLFGLMIFCFIRVIFSDAGEIPEWFYDPNSFNAKLKRKVVETKSDGSERYCSKCKVLKPDRAHHCRVCGRCYLKMDHHCPWVNNCIGYFNYKIFILFITYSLATTLFVFVITLIRLPMVNFSKDLGKNVLIILNAMITGALSLALLGFVSFHYFLLTHNYTTIEFLEKRGCGTNQKQHLNYYDIGTWGNVTRAMGSNPILWPFPFTISMIDQCQGTSFDVNDLYINPDA